VGHVSYVTCSEGCFFRMDLRVLMPVGGCLGFGHFGAFRAKSAVWVLHIHPKLGQKGAFWVSGFHLSSPGSWKSVASTYLECRVSWMVERVRGILECCRINK